MNRPHAYACLEARSRAYCTEPFTPEEFRRDVRPNNDWRTTERNLSVTAQWKARDAKQDYANMKRLFEYRRARILRFCQ